MREIIEKDLMVFISSPDFADNSRGLWEYVVKNTNYKTLWIIRDEKIYKLLLDKGIECALEGSELAEKNISKAHYLITSSFDLAYQKKIGQIHVAAWHGFPLKVIGFFDNATSNLKEYEGLKVITTQTDLITATSRLSRLTLSGMFAVDPRKVKETGYPRNDIMFWSDAENELQKLIDIDVKKSNLFFYLPTMRKGLKEEGEHFEKNIFNYSDYDVKVLDDFLEKNNAYIVAKVHFADNEKYKRGDFQLPRRLLFLDTQTMNEHMCTIYHIMAAFDGLITDYSSIYADYMLLNKPILFSCPDMEKYKKDRGFIADDPTIFMPGAIVKTQNELIKNLKKILEGKDEYKDVRAEKISLFHNHFDADSSKRVLKEMEKISVEGGNDSSKTVGNLFQNYQSPLSQYVMQEVEAELFFDVGEGFNEKNKITRKYSIRNKDNNICMEVNIPDNVCAIRFDPDDCGRTIMKNTKIYLDGNERDDYVVVGGNVVDNMICFGNPDPQIIISLESQKVKEFRIEFEYVDLYEHIGSVIKKMCGENYYLNKKIEQLRWQLGEIYKSTSWKVTEIFRKINRIINKRKNYD